MKDINCWILTNPRSGSTYLCNILNNTLLFSKPHFEEFYNKRNKNNRISNDNLMPRVKILGYQFEELGFKNLDIINNKLPKLKFIHLYRENIYERAMSLYFSNESQIYYIKNRRGIVLKKINFDYDKILICYHNTLKYQNIWKNMLNEKHDYIEIVFEYFIKNKKENINKILSFLDLKYDNIDLLIEKCNYHFFPTKRPETEEYIRRFKEINLK